MTGFSRKKSLFFLSLIVVCALCSLYITKIHSSLATSKPFDAKVLFVEGWLDGIYFDQVCDEINKNSYHTIITTGGSLPSMFNMYTNGALVYQLDEIFPKKNLETISNVSLSCSGTPVDGVYPHVRVWVDTMIIAEFEVERKTCEYNFSFPRAIRAASKIYVEFTNDYYSKTDDRNLYIHNVSVNKIEMGVLRSGVYYDRGLIDGEDCYKVDVKSYAQQAKRSLVRRGIDEDLVFAVEPNNEKNNRTLQHALAVETWALENGVELSSVNIITKGTHALRSKMIYQDVMGKNTKIGVIAIPSKSYNSERWFLSRAGVRSVVYESIAIVYYWLLLLFV